MSDKSQFALVASSFAELELMLIEADGEPTAEIQEKLRGLMANVDLCASLLERIESHEEFLRKKAAEYTRAARGCARSTDYLKQMIKDDMTAHEVNEIKGASVRFKLSSSKPRLVIEEESLDPAYLMHVQVPDKRKIEEALELGLMVQGARFEETKSLRTYLNKKVE